MHTKVIVKEAMACQVRCCHPYNNITCSINVDLALSSIVPRPPEAFNRVFGFKSGLGLVDFVPSSLRQVDAIVTSCPIWLLLGEFTALYK